MVLHLVRGACGLADLLTMIIVGCHTYLSNLVPNLFPTLPMLHLVTFPVLLEVRLLYCGSSFAVRSKYNRSVLMVRSKFARNTGNGDPLSNNYYASFF